jgi:hypothetical protein
MAVMLIARSRVTRPMFQMMDLDRRTFLAIVAAAAACSESRAQPGPILRPEDFGAKGDGTTNDTPAFAALSAQVNRIGGGTIALRRGATYVVGRQTARGPYRLSPDPIIELKALSEPLEIEGNGARLAAQPGLRFGSFDTSGAPLHRPMPNLHGEELAVPYQAMISIEDCRAPVTIRDVELDGNIQRLRIGGQYGDTGWQVPGTGVILRNNLSSETLINVLSHHHPQDGVMIDGSLNRSGRSSIQRLVSRFNGRQGVSLVAGRGYDFADCEFSFTGRSVISSAPGAGVDIEAEKRPIRDLTFARCKFVDNHGPGLVADSGDSAGAEFSDCQFVGTDIWSAWPNKPGFVFRGCTFAGAVVHPFASPDAALATKFDDCRFVDDPALSPNGKLYLEAAGGPCVNMAVSDNVAFRRCTFDLRHQGMLPWSWKAIYADCTMTQRRREKAMPKGKYLGRTTIEGMVDLYGSMIVGTVILNGTPVAKGPYGDIAPW